MSVDVESVVAHGEDPIAGAIRAEQLVPHADDLLQTDIELLRQAQAERAWVNAASLASVIASRAASRAQGETLLEARRQNLRDGEYDQVPEAVDPLSEARRAREAAKLYGNDSPEHQRAQTGLLISCERLVAEIRRVQTWEYFAELEQPYEEWAGGYTFESRILSDMVDDGITPLADSEEGANRLTEKVEEATYGALRGLGAVALQESVAGARAARREMRVNTISECNDSAIKAYKRDVAAGKKPAASYNGHVPSIEKFMIRGVRYGTDTDSRYQEQLALSGKYVTRKIIINAMRMLSVIEPGHNPTKAEVRATQMVNLNGEGVLAVAALLDELASHASGKRIFLGEVIPEDRPKDYASVPAIAAQRQAKQKGDAQEVVNYLVQLDQNGVDPVVAGGRIDTFIANLLHERVKHNPAEAAHAYDDKEILHKIEEYNQRLADGDIEGARRIDAQMKADLPPPVYCGAGACGLEGVDPKSLEGAAALRLGLKAKEKSELLHDKERPCPGCNRLKVYYDKTGNKACTGCAFSQIDGKISGGKEKAKDKKQFALAA